MLRIIDEAGAEQAWVAARAHLITLFAAMSEAAGIP